MFAYFIKVPCITDDLDYQIESSILGFYVLRIIRRTIMHRDEDITCSQ